MKSLITDKQVRDLFATKTILSITPLILLVFKKSYFLTSRHKNNFLSVVAMATNRLHGKILNY